MAAADRIDLLPSVTLDDNWIAINGPLPKRVLLFGRSAAQLRFAAQVKRNSVAGLAY